MTIAVKVLLTVALIFSIAVPFGAFAAGEKTRGRYKTALAANTVMFFGTMLFAVCVLFNGTAFAAESTAAAGGISTGMGYIAAAALPFPQQHPQHSERSVRILPFLVNP